MNWDFQPQRQIDWADVANDIRDAVTMDDAVAVYAPQIPVKNHRCPCPFHDGKDYNFSFTRNGYRCFVCGATGDVITFVKDLLGLSTRVDAMKRLNEDFHLGIIADTNISTQISADVLKRRAERKKKDDAIRAWWDEYHRLWDEWTALDRTRMTAPLDSDEYAYAVRRMDYISYLIDSLPPEPR